ncbi:unnamed protein product [Arabidopsis halleri]
MRQWKAMMKFSILLRKLLQEKRRSLFPISLTKLKYQRTKLHYQRSSIS